MTVCRGTLNREDCHAKCVSVCVWEGAEVGLSMPVCWGNGEVKAGFH